jgi:hypothetical protein
MPQELTKGGKVQALQDKVNALDREITKLRAQWEMDSANVTDEQKRAAVVKKNVKEVSNSQVRCQVEGTWLTTEQLMTARARNIPKTQGT